MLLYVSLILTFLISLQTSYRGRKALNLGGVVSPRNQQPAQQQQTSVSPAPAAVPHQSPNTTTGTPTAQQQQNNLIGAYFCISFVGDFNDWILGIPRISFSSF